VAYRKPFFMEELIGRKIEVVDPHALGVPVGHLFIASKAFLTPSFEPISCWNVWKRGVKFSEFIVALKNRSLTLLEESMCIAKTVSNNP